jgi:DNA repair exonuclease SbcCD ATPase subunit
MADNEDNKLNYIQSKLDTVADTCSNIDKELAIHKAAFEAHLEQDQKMYEEFKKMNEILRENTDSLKEHMHRTELLENAIVKMDQRLSPIEIEHIQKDAINKFISKKATLIAKIAGAVTAVIGVFMLLKPYIVLLLK